MVYLLELGSSIWWFGVVVARVLYHSNDKVVFFIKGNGCIASFPENK